MIVERPTSGLTFESLCCYYWYDYMYNLDGNLANTVTDSTGRHTILILQLEKNYCYVMLGYRVRLISSVA